MSATILYIDTIPGDSIQETIFAGICRYAASRKWDAAAVPREDSRPEKIPTLLAAHQPLAGCIVECSDGRRDLPPRASSFLIIFIIFDLKSLLIISLVSFLKLDQFNGLIIFLS